MQALTQCNQSLRLHVEEKTLCHLTSSLSVDTLFMSAKRLMQFTEHRGNTCCSEISEHLFPPLSQAALNFNKVGDANEPNLSCTLFANC